MQLTGYVSHGSKKARTWGYPTANVWYSKLHAQDKEGAALGTYYGVVDIPGFIKRDCLVYVNGAVLEIHIRDFQSEIYSHKISLNIKRQLFPHFVPFGQIWAKKT